MDGNNQVGTVYGYLGSSNGLNGKPDFQVWGVNSSDWFGDCIRRAGDVDNDGIIEVLIAAEGANNGTNADAGQAYLFKPMVDISKNPSINIGETKGPDWTYTGLYYTNSTIQLNKTKIITYLKNPPLDRIFEDKYGIKMVKVLINITSDSKCKMILSNINFSYNATFKTPDLASSFNLYIKSHPSEVKPDGYIDVPLKFSIESPGKLFISNLTVIIDSPPMLIKIPNKTIDEDSKVVNLYNLYDFFHDDFDTQENLMYFVESYTNMSHISVSLNQSHYLNADATIPGGNNWTGCTKVIVSAVDSRGQKQISNIFTIIINQVDDPPVWLLPITPIHIAEDSSIFNYSGLRPFIKDIENDSLELRIISIDNPTVLNITTNTSTKDDLDIKTICLDYYGLANFTLRVLEIDNSTMHADATIKIIIDPVNDPPRFTSNPSLMAIPNIIYNYQVTAVDPEGDSIGFALDEGPLGMSMTPENRLSWTPTSADIGLHKIIIRATDGKASSNQSFTLNVTQSTGNHPPFITSIPIKKATVGYQYIYRVIATDPDGDNLTYSLLKAPEGMTITLSTGEITWTPDEAQVGEKQVIISVSDGYLSITQEFVLVVSAEGMNHKPQITSSPPTHAVAGEQYSYRMNATDKDGDILIFSLSEYPKGMTIDAESGLLIWIPIEMDVGFHNVTISVSDGKGTVKQSFRIEVIGNQPPIAILKASKLKIAQGENVRFNASSSTDQDGKVSEYYFDFGDGENSSWTNNPETSHKYSKPGKYNVTLIVKDNKGKLSTNKPTIIISVQKNEIKVLGLSLIWFGLLLVLIIIGC